MRRVAIGFVLGLAAFCPVPAMADITVLSPGIVNGPLRVLAGQWTARTGQKVTITGANVGRIRESVQAGAPADLVLAATADFKGFAARLAGAPVTVGRIQFGVVVKKGGRRPDISTEEKFIAFASQPQTQKVFSENIPYGPVHKGTLELLPADVQAALPTAPANLQGARSVDSAFWVDHGEELELRFNAWAAR